MNDTYGDGNTYRGETSKDSDIYTYKISVTQPSSHIQFCKPDGTEIMRISKDGVTVSPDVPVDEAAQTVINALDVYIKQMVKREWVDLTDDEMLMIYLQPHENKKYSLGRMVQQKLKEKNTKENNNV
jgi:hypothetical protein